MSTRAIIAFTYEGNHYAKYSHHGAYEDYIDELNDAVYSEFVQSVMRGDSSEPFGGFYDDIDHCCRGLGWSFEAYLSQVPKTRPQKFSSKEELFAYANHNFADYIYVKTRANHLIIYERNGNTYLKRNRLDNKEEMLFDLENLEGEIEYDDAIAMMGEALEELRNLDIDWDLEELIENHNLDTIGDCKTLEDCYAWMNEYNKALDDFDEEE